MSNPKEKIQNIKEKIIKYEEDLECAYNIIDRYIDVIIY